MDRIASSNTAEDIFYIKDQLDPAKTDSEETSVLHLHQTQSNFSDRFKVPSPEYTSWQSLRSDPVQFGTFVNTITSLSGNVAVCSWDNKELKTYSFSPSNSEAKSETMKEESHYHDRNEWTLGPAHYVRKCLLESGFKKSINRIASFSDFKENWDSYGAKPIQSLTIARAINLFSVIVDEIGRLGKAVPLPFIAPCSDGGIQFEWEMCNKELTIVIPPNISQSLEYLWVYSLATDEEHEKEGIFGTDKQAIKSVDCLLSPKCIGIT